MAIDFGGLTKCAIAAPRSGSLQANRRSGLRAKLGHTTTEMLFRTYSRYVPNLVRRDGTAFDRMIAGALHGGLTTSNHA